MQVSTRALSALLYRQGVDHAFTGCGKTRPCKALCQGTTSEAAEKVPISFGLVLPTIFPVQEPRFPLVFVSLRWLCGPRRLQRRLFVFSYVRCDVALAQGRDELLLLIELVGSQRDGPASASQSHLVGHGQSCLPLRLRAGLGGTGRHHQPIPVLDDHMPRITGLGLPCRALLIQARLRIGRRLMRVAQQLPPSRPRPPARRLVLSHELLRLAQASISVASTVKCSSLNSSCARACSTMATSNRCDTSPCISRSRFLVNTVASHTASSEFSPINQRYSRLKPICSIGCRSLRMEYRTCSNSARSSFSGAIEGRPRRAYNASKRPTAPAARPPPWPESVAEDDRPISDPPH